MKGLQIIAACVLAAIIYGIVHDEITIRISPDYFLVWHPKLIETTNLTLVALAWGIIATWWAGALIGLLVCAAARLGPLPKLEPREIIKPLLKLLLVMGAAAFVAGLTGYYASFGNDSSLNAAWFAHTASYGMGFLGGIILSALLFLRRVRSAMAQSTSPPNAGDV